MYLNNLAVLSSPIKGEVLKLYLAASDTAISAVLLAFLVNPEGSEIIDSLQFLFPTTNNMVEYEALLAD